MNYLVTFFDLSYEQHFIVVQTSTPNDAEELVSKLPKVAAVISVWQEAT